MNVLRWLTTRSVPFSGGWNVRFINSCTQGNTSPPKESHTHELQYTSDLIKYHFAPFATGKTRGRRVRGPWSVIRHKESFVEESILWKQLMPIISLRWEENFDVVVFSLKKDAEVEKFSPVAAKRKLIQMDWSRLPGGKGEGGQLCSFRIRKVLFDWKSQSSYQADWKVKSWFFLIWSTVEFSILCGWLVLFFFG